MKFFLNDLVKNPVIASISDLSNLDTALASNCKVIFLLTGNIFNLKEISNKVSEKNKLLFIYVDEIDGFSKDSWGLEYIVKNIALSGIITSKSNIIKQSKDMGVFTIQRMLIYDFKSLEDLFLSIKENRPHGIEILPGIIPRVINLIARETKIPLIAGGLFFKTEDIILSLESGAIAISTGNINLWQD